MNKRFELCLIIILFVLSGFGTIDATAQATIQGPADALTSSTQTYTCTTCSVFWDMGSGQEWKVTNGTIIGSTTNYNSVSVQWSGSSGTGTIAWRTKFTVFVQRDINIGTLPAVPATPTFEYQCTQGNIIYTGTPPAGVKWYWQTSNTGTNTADSLNTRVVLSSGTSYLRAKNVFGWSTTSASVFYPGTDSSIPAAAVVTSGERCGNGSITLFSNGGNDRWYEVSTGGSAIYTGTTYAPTLTASKTYYVQASTVFNCVSTTRTAVTGTISAATQAGTLNITTPVFNEANGTLTLSGSVGAIQKWQQQETGGAWTDITNTTTAYQYGGIIKSTDFRVLVQSGSCAAATSAVSSIVVHAAPSITASNTSIIMGDSVTLDAGPSYSTYTWKDIAQTTVGSHQVYTTTKPGKYTVTVTRAGVTGSGTASYEVLAQLAGLQLNYIVTNTMLVDGITDSNYIDGLSVEQKAQSINYFDGLGRPIQSVITQGSSLKKDVVQPMVYDEYGREPIHYLPYVSTENTGLYKENATGLPGNYEMSPQGHFYTDPNNLIARDQIPYAVTVFEKSPAGRIVKQGSPGQDWQPNSTASYASNDNTVKYEYTFNIAEEVLRWKVIAPDVNFPLGRVDSDSSGIVLRYEAKQLYKNKTKDEQGHEVIEFKDKQGKVILKKVQADGSTYAQTYYIYDDFSQLVCVIQPEGVKNIASYFVADAAGRNAFLNTWAFRYTYDGRRRMVTKQVPGSAPVYMVYDKRDRLVLTQDGNQRDKKQWMFTKYDQLNRPVMTGLYAHSDSISREAMNALISTTAFAESYDETKPHGYTTAIFPNTNLTVHSVTFYDNYTFRDDLAGSSYNFKHNHLAGQETTYFNRVVGQVTGTKTNILGTNNYLWTINYYDDDYRVIQSIVQNHKDSLDLVTNVYDFVGKVLKTKTTHSTTTTATNITRSFKYDHAGRLLKIYHQINGQDSILLSQNEYNELGQLVTKKLHSEDNGATFKQPIDYRYNIRGWMTRINDLTSSDRFFNMELFYENGFANPQYNGNISGMKWKNLFEGKESSYGFTYDPMNRLREASYAVKNEITNNWTEEVGRYNEHITAYDLNGNILGLERWGVTNPATQTFGKMDNLAYTYIGNQLQSVTDASANAQGFKDGNTSGNDYAYDVNGNMHTDKNKQTNANGITYNHLNLPVEVLKANGEKYIFTFNASGIKLKQQEYDSTSVLRKTTDYAGEFIYENDTLQFVQHEEGRVIMTGATPEYQYYLKDHLGNIRLTFTSKEENDTVTATLETANATGEQNEFLYYDEAVKINSQLFDHTNTGTTYYAARLNGTTNERYGLAKSLSVMPGDTIKAEVYAKYLDTNSNNWTTALTNFMAAIAGGTAPPGTFVDGGATGSTGGTTPSFIGLLNKGSESGTAPKAYLNYLVFDRNYLPIDGGFVRMTENAKEHGQDVAHERLAAEIPITEAGYVYIYISNDNAALGGSTVETYWDDLTIEHIKTPVLQTQNFYPFGLTFGEYTREYALENRWKFQGQEHIKRLGWVSFKWRNDMPDIGRFFNIDPLAESYVYNSTYAFAENKVTTFVELEGLEIGPRASANSNRPVVRRSGGNPVTISQAARSAANIANRPSGFATTTPRQGALFSKSTRYTFDRGIGNGGNASNNYGRTSNGGDESNFDNTHGQGNRTGNAVKVAMDIADNARSIIEGAKEITVTESFTQHEGINFSLGKDIIVGDLFTNSKLAGLENDYQQAVSQDAMGNMSKEEWGNLSEGTQILLIGFSQQKAGPSPLQQARARVQEGKKDDEVRIEHPVISQGRN